MVNFTRLLFIFLIIMTRVLLFTLGLIWGTSLPFIRVTFLTFLMLRVMKFLKQRVPALIVVRSDDWDVLLFRYDPQIILKVTIGRGLVVGLTLFVIGMSTTSVEMTSKSASVRTETY